MSVTAATIEANQIIKEWEIYGVYLACIRLDEKNVMFAVRVMGLIGLRLEFAVDVYWLLNDD